MARQYLTCRHQLFGLGLGLGFQSQIDILTSRFKCLFAPDGIGNLTTAIMYDLDVHFLYLDLSKAF